MPKSKSFSQEFILGTLRPQAIRVFFAVLVQLSWRRYHTSVYSHTRGRVRMVLGTVVAIALVSSLAFGLTRPATSAAATSSNLNFQARLQSGAGAIVPDGSYNLEFKLYNTSSGGTALWTEDYLNSASHGVQVINGYLSVNLGSVTAFPTDINWDQDMYVTMNVGGTTTGSPGWDGEMNPRLKLTAVPYAFQSKSAEQLQKAANGHVATLSFASPSADNSITLPDASGTVCLQNSTDCGFALTEGSTHYVQNSTSLQGSTNFNIRSAGTGSTTVALQALTSQSANLLEFRDDTGAATTSFNAGGSLNISSGNLTVGGNTLLRTVSDSATAFQIQNAYGSSALTVDTTALTVRVGGSAPVSFAAKSDITTGNGPYNVATGDFNGDGKTDAITANYAASGATVFINTGSGLPSTGTSLTAASGTWAAATGDFNGDGKSDAIIVNNNDNSAYVYVSNGSTLPATATSILTTGTSPTSAATGDFNGDGKTDAVITNSNSSTASVYINTGTALPTTATYTINTGGSPQDVTTGDLNGDGKLDIATVNSSSVSVSIFINTGSALPTNETYNLDTGSTPNSLATGDFNGDGKLDIITANTGSANASVYINASNNVLPKSATATLTTGTNPYSIATGDFNGDGSTDVVVPGYGSGGSGNSAYVFISNGSSGLPSTYSSTLTTNTGPLAVATGDFNGDGSKDIIVTNYQGSNGNTASVFLNSASYTALEVKGGQQIITNSDKALEVRSAESNVSVLTVDTNGLEVKIDSGTDGKSGLKFSQLNSGSATSGEFSGILGVDSNGNVGLADISTISDQLMNYWGDLAWDTQNDRLGIGNAAPDYKLDVKDTVTGGYVARIQNAATATSSGDSGSSANGLLIQLGTDNASRTTGNYFIGFAGGTSGAGTVAGKIQGGASGVAYTTSGADYAEYFKANPSDLPQVGEIVSLDPATAQGVVRSGGSTSPFGIISANPGFLGNGPICALDNANCDSDYARDNVIVGLNGQLPTRISVANGAINIGDPIMASGSQPGVGVKATGYSRIIGYAEEAASADGVIKVLVQPGVFDPVAATNLQGSGNPLNIDSDLHVSGNTVLEGTLNVGKALNAPSISVITAAVSGNLTVIGTTTTGNLNVLGSATIQTLTINGVATFAQDIKLGAPINTRQATLKSFKASKPITAGSAVILDNRDGHEGEITTTTSVNDSRVIGVAVSDAQHEGDTIDVAISGWVQVRVDTTKDASGHAPAPLSAGQLISTSLGEGTVQTPSSPATGSVLGKTTSKQDANNLVWIMITLQ